MARERSGRKWAEKRIKRGKGAQPASSTPAPASPASADTEQWKVEFLPSALTEFRAWPDGLRASLGRIFDRIKARGLTSLTEEHAKQLRGKVWELRASADKQEGRALYVSVTGKRVVVVVCEIKTTRTTPAHWITLAEARAKTIGQSPPPKPKGK